MPNFIWMCSLCRLPVAKNHNFGQILTFWGLLYRPPLTDEGQMWCAITDPWYTFKCQISSRPVYSLALCWLKSQFLPFFGFRHLVLSAIGNSLTKTNTVHNYKPSPIQRHQNRFCTPTPSWRNRAQNLWRWKAWRTDKQADKKTQCFWPPRRRLKSEPHQTWHGDRGPRARSCTSKTFGIWRIVSPLGGAENLGITRPRQLKTP